MKIFFTTLFLLISFSIFADSTPQVPSTDSDTKAKPEASGPTSTAQKQEQKPGEENKFEIGPYNQKGEYIFFDRLEREQREAEEEAAEQN